MASIWYIETFIGTIEVRKDINGKYNIPRDAKEELKTFAHVKHFQFQILADKNDGLWFCIIPKGQTPKNLLGTYRINELECPLKHHPCSRKCLTEKIDYSYP